MRDDLVRAVWHGDGFAALIMRAALTPFEWIYGAVSLVVGARRARGAGRAAVPTVSVGNLTVGGTGKTPVAAWFAARLHERGLAPALLLRGYGDDETLVHERLNESVPVIADPDRRRGAGRAIAQGARALVLDDAFQHRQMPRTLDVVLVSADLWDGTARLLPAGPFREPLMALRRAQLVVVTRKAASSERARAVAVRLTAESGGVPVAVVHLAPDRLVRWADGASEPVEALRGGRTLAVSGIGAPGAFAAQLRASGAVVDEAPFGDHHAYSARDVDALVARAAPGMRVVCTLKDAVKLGPRWPASAPGLWYLSQSVLFEAGAETVESLLDRLRPAVAPATPAPSGPKTESNG